MKNRIFYFFLLIMSLSFFFQSNVVAQKDSEVTFYNLMNNEENSYYDIVGELYSNPEILNELTDKERKRFDRWQYWWRSRVGPNGEFTTATEELHKYLRSQKDDDLIEENRLTPSGTCGPGTGIESKNFTFLGPDKRPSGTSRSISQGKMTDIWINPTNFNHMYASAQSGGLWKTLDGGQNWVNLTDDVILCGVKNFAVDPNNNNVIYLATHMHGNGTIRIAGPGGTYSQGLLKSVDGGTNWTLLNVNAPMELNVFWDVIIDPNNSNIVYALSKYTVYKSTNAGVTWSNTNVPVSATSTFNERLRSIRLDVNSSNTIFVSGRDCFFKSNDGGITWSDIYNNTNFSSFLYTENGITIDAHNSGIYALLDDVTSGSTKLLKSTNGGSSWTLINSYTSLSVVPHAFELKVAPNNDIYVGGINIYRSTNNGSSFSSIMSNNIHVDFQEIEFPDVNNSNLVYVTNDGGLWKSTNMGNTWINITGNIGVNEVYNIAISETTHDLYYIGVHDGGTMKYNSTLSNWEFKTGGDGGTSLIDYSNDNIYFYQINTSAYRRDGSFLRYLGKSPEYDGNIILHPQNPSTIYFSILHGGLQKIMVSHDAGVTWQNFTNHGLGERPRTAEISESNPDVFYYSTLSWDFTVDPWLHFLKLFKTGDSGNTWIEISQNIGVQTSQVEITGIKINPTNSDHVWISLSSFSDGNKVFETVDGGVTWSNISNNLPNFPTQCIEYDPRNNELFLGTDVGLYKKCVDYGDWTLVTGLPRVVVSDLELNSTSGELIISTYGRGNWKVDLDGYCYPPVTTNIYSSTLWNNLSICGDLVIHSGTLTIGGQLIIPLDATITVKSGAKLLLYSDNSIILNSNIIVESNGELIVENGGVLKQNYEDEIVVNTGGIFECSEGEILDISN